MGKALRCALSRGGQNALFPCPDDNTMATYLDGLLSPGEKLTLEEHVSRCATCREVLGLALEAGAVDAAAAAPEPAVANARPVLWWLRSPVAALAAVGFIAIASAVLVKVVTGPGGPGAVTQVSTLRRAALEESRPASAESQKSEVGSEKKPKEPPTEGLPTPPPPARSTGAATASGLAGTHGRKAAEDSAGVPPRRLEPGPVVGGVIGGVPELKGEVAAAPVRSAEDEMRSDAVQSKVARAAREELRPAASAVSMQAAMSPAQAVRALSEEGTDGFQARVVQGRLFYRVGNYWVDARCAGRSGDRVVELSPGSARSEEVLSDLPDLVELTQGRVQALLCRDSEIVVLSGEH